jgi:hypothetical protein
MKIITKGTKMDQKIKPSSLIKMIVILCLLVGILLIANVALAHETITVGDYAVEYGWINEPAVVGQPNAVVINITSIISQANSTSSEVDTSGLQISVVFGPQTKVLSL